MSGYDHNHAFERAARASHAEALAHVSPETLSRLRPRAAQSATRADWMRPAGWSVAAGGAFAALFALAIGIGPMNAPNDDAVADETLAGLADAPELDLSPELLGDAVALFDEDPELFLWLASAEALPLAME